MTSQESGGITASVHEVDQLSYQGAPWLAKLDILCCTRLTFGYFG